MLLSWLVHKFRTLFVKKKFRTLFSAYTSTSMHLSMNLLRFLEKLLIYFENNLTIINFSFFQFFTFIYYFLYLYSIFPLFPFIFKIYRLHDFIALHCMCSSSFLFFLLLTFYYFYMIL